MASLAAPGCASSPVQSCAELVVGQDAIARLLRETLDDARGRVRVDELPVERDREHARDERLDAVDAVVSPLPVTRVEQLVDVRARDAPERERSPGRQEVALDLLRLVLPVLGPAASGTRRRPGRSRRT